MVVEEIERLNIRWNFTRQIFVALLSTRFFAKPARSAVASPNSNKSTPLPIYLNILCGGIAGWCELLCLYPTDVVKTRAQQVVEGKRPSLVGSLVDLVKEGGIPRLYRGKD